MTEGQYEALQNEIKALRQVIRQIQADVNHWVNPVIGWLRLKEAKPDVDLNLAAAVEHLRNATAACSAESVFSSLPSTGETTDV